MLRSLVKTFLPMLKSMTKMLILSIMEDSSPRSIMDQNSGSKAMVIAEEVTGITKVVRNVITVKLITHLASEKTVFSAKRKDILVHTADLARTANNVVIHLQEDLDVNMNWNKMTMVMIGHFP